MRAFLDSISRVCLAGGLWGTTLLLASSATLRGEEVESVLRLPVSPGSIALLAAHTGDPRTAARLELALASSSAEVRGVAARVINLGSLSRLLAAAAAALEREADPDSAREEIRLLCSLGGSSYDEAISRPRTDCLRGSTGSSSGS